KAPKLGAAGDSSTTPSGDAQPNPRSTAESRPPQPTPVAAVAPEKKAPPPTEPPARTPKAAARESKAGAGGGGGGSTLWLVGLVAGIAAGVVSIPLGLASAALVIAGAASGSGPVLAVGGLCGGICGCLACLSCVGCAVGIPVSVVVYLRQPKPDALEADSDD